MGDFEDIKSRKMNDVLMICSGYGRFRGYKITKNELVFDGM